MTTYLGLVPEDALSRIALGVVQAPGGERVLMQAADGDLDYALGWDTCSRQAAALGVDDPNPEACRRLCDRALVVAGYAYRLAREAARIDEARRLSEGGA